MKKLHLSLALILTIQSLCSQSITHYRYWFDDNFAGRTLVSVSSGTTLNLNQAINASSLSAGAHIATLQFKDNQGKWSVPIATSFVKTKPFSSKIVGYRYWINDNFSGQTYKPLSSLSVQNIMTSIDVSSGNKGSNIVTFQFKDSLGNWSVPIASSFVRESSISPQIVSYRYWFNGEIANLTEVSITPTNVLTGNLSLDASFLGIGTHTVSTQYKNAKNVWSVPTADNFYKNTPATKKNKYAYLTLSKTIASQGDTIRISGFNFPQSSSDSVKIYNNQYGTQWKIPYTTSATGSFQITKIIGSSEDGYNYVGAYDSVNKRNVAIERYEVVKTTTPTANRFLQIIVPQGKKFFDLQNNALMNILWKDKIYNTAKIVNKSANSTKSHTIEYKINGGAWTVADTRTKLTTKGLLKSEQVFDYVYKFKQSGQYQFRVSETDNPDNWDTTSQLIVTNSADTNVFISKEWDYSAPKYNSNPFAICADGTARVYIKVKKKSNYPFDISQVKISATDADGLTTQTKYVGMLMATNNIQTYDTSANTANAISATHTTKGYDDAYWFWYVAPDNFARELGDDYKGERTVNFKVEVLYTNKPTEIYNTSIQIFRPPLLLVHGLGGDEHTWDDMELPSGLGKLKDAKNLFKAGIRANNMEKSASFFINAQILLHKPVVAENAVFANSFQANILMARKDGISANRVDYVCHSMGGSVLRTAINQYPNDFYPISGKFLNYNRGFVNKVITINTPHNGATTADFLDFVAPRFNTKLKSILFGGHLIGNYVLNDKVYTFFKPTKKILGIPTEYGVTDAVSNLQHYNANSTSGGVRFSETKNVKSYLIGSTMIKDNNTLTLFDNDKILNIVFNIAANIDNVKKNPLQALDYMEGFFASRYNTSNFSLKSDWVVQVPSQLAGGDYANLKPHEFLINGGLNSMHTKITSNVSVGHKVFEVLNKDIHSNTFANSIPANPAAGGIRVRSGEVRTIDSVLEYFNDTSKFNLTTNILDNYNIDTNINFTINLKDTTNLKLVSFVFQGEVYEGNLLKGMSNYSIKVNSNHIDSQTFLISLKYDSSGYDVYHNYTKVIKVIPYNLPESLSINPELKMLNRREGYAPEIITNHGTFISNIALNNSDLIINIADDKVVKYIDTLGRFVAGDSGSTYVSLEYKGKRDTIYFAINPSIEEENAPCIAPISSLNIVSNKLSITTENNSQNTSIFNWSFGDGTFSTEQTPSHTYSINGDYNVCLTSYNPCDSHKVCKTVSVCDKPIIDFDLVISSAEVTTTNKTTNATSYKWSFGDGQSDNSTSPKHTYTANGEYDICLTAYNNCDSATICKKLKIEGISSGIFIYNSQGVNIYPNPVASLIYIELEKQNYNTIKIVNNLGQELLSKTINNLRTQLNINSLSKGIYFIELSNTNGDMLKHKFYKE